MKDRIRKCMFGFGFDHAAHSTGNAFSAGLSSGSDDLTITTTQRCRQDIRNAVREIYMEFNP